MGQKDISEKLLEDYNDVFADITNVLLFNGRQLIQERDLKDAGVRSRYKAFDNKLHEQERDTLKIWQNTAIRQVFIGYENQSAYYRYMPVRILGYDGATYRSQLLKREEQIRGQNRKLAKLTEQLSQKQNQFKQQNCSNTFKSDQTVTELQEDISELTDKITHHRQQLKQIHDAPVSPVATVVLNFSDRRWNGVQSLYDCISVPEEMKPFVNDYKITVIDIAYLTQEQLSLFHSDFKFIAEYFVQKRLNHDYKPSKDMITHVDALLKMFSALTGDSRYEQILYDNNLTEGGSIGMCEILDKIEERGRNEGKIEGRIEGKIEGSVITYFECGKSIEFIADKLGISEEKVKDILNEQ